MSLTIRYSGCVTDATNSEFNEQAEIEYLRTTPVETILANHMFVLLQLGAIHLGTTPPNLNAAKLVIDSISAMISGVGDRLGENSPLYKAALAELQQAYVRATTAS